MSVNPNLQPINKIRYKKKAVQDDNWIRNMLIKAPYGVLATTEEDQPFLNPNLYAYDQEKNVLYLHTSDKGRTPSNIAANPKICFTVTEMGRLLPNETSRDFSVEYSSVILFGKAYILENEAERLTGLRLLLEKYFPHLKEGKNFPVLTAEEMKGTAVYRIDIESWSGKRNIAPTDFSGAFDYTPQNK